MSSIHPIIIQNHEIPTNVFFAPINPGFAHNGQISKNFTDFFVSHSGHNTGICYVGNVALQQELRSNPNTAVLSQTSRDDWRIISDSIRSHGSLAGIQLAWKPPQMVLQREFISSNKEKQIQTFKDFYHNFDEFQPISDLFIESIYHVAACGFSVVQIHAAHGYALSLLLSRVISESDDPDKTKGIKLLRRILEGINSNGVVLDIRLSLYEDLYDRQRELEYKTRLFELLHESGFNIISLSNGFYNLDKTMIYPEKNGKPVILEDARNLAANHPEIIWNAAGNMEYALMSKTRFPENLTFSIYSRASSLARSTLLQSSAWQPLFTRICFPVSLIFV